MSLLIIVLTGFIGFNYGDALSSVRTNARIVGGTHATISEAPYQVALIYGTHLGCGGTIISTNAVLTAAHCTQGSHASSWRVRAGTSFHNSGGQLIGANRLIVHDNYNLRRDNDISIIYLTTQLALGTNVAVVTLPAQGHTVEDGASAFVTGWGRLGDVGAYPGQLQKVTIPVINQQQCANAYKDFNPVTSNMICAGNIGNDGQGICHGDYGGPMTVRNILIGISSWSNGCGRTRFAGVFTRVPNYRTWINSNIY